MPPKNNNNAAAAAANNAAAAAAAVEEASNNWFNDLVNPDGNCIFCLRAQKVTGTYIASEYKGRKKYNTSNLKVHFATHKISQPSDLSAEQKTLMEENVEAHQAAPNAAIECEKALIQLFASRGLPDDLVQDPLFTTFIDKVIANKGMPLKTAETFVQKRTEVANKLYHQLGAWCKNKLVNLQLDIVTRCGNRFLGVVIQTFNHTVATAVPSPIQGDQTGSLEYIRPFFTAQRTFLFDLRCDRQTPFTAAPINVVNGPEEFGAAAAAAELIEDPIEVHEELNDELIQQAAAAALAAQEEVSDEDEDEDEDDKNDYDGKMSAKKMALRVKHLLAELASVGATVIGICTDNGSNFVALAKQLRKLGIYLNDNRCFAHLGQKISNKWFGYHHLDPDIPSHNNVVVACIALRKWLRTKKNIYVPEPVLTRWNTFFDLVAHIYKYFLKPWYDHNDDTVDAPHGDIVDALRLVCWPTNRPPGARQCVETCKMFLDRLQPMKTFTNVVQTDGACLLVGIPAFSHVYNAINTQATIRYLPSFKARLTAPRGRFLTDTVVLFLALLPWSVVDGRRPVDQAAHDTFMNNAEKLIDRCSAVGFEFGKAKTYRDRLKVAFQTWRGQPRRTTPLRTGKRFRDFWENMSKPTAPVAMQTLAYFALNIAAISVSEAACERSFSRVKYIISALRARTTPRNVYNQVLIKEFDLVKKESQIVFFSDRPADVPAEDFHMSDAFTKWEISDDFVVTCMKEFNKKVAEGKIKLDAGVVDGDVDDDAVGGDDEVGVVAAAVPEKECCICGGKTNNYVKCDAGEAERGNCEHRSVICAACHDGGKNTTCDLCSYS